MFKTTLISLLFLGVTALAAGPCAKDKMTFCKDVIKDKAKLAACMKLNEPKFSQVCKDHRALVKENNSEIKAACSEDYKKYCADVKPGERRPMKCLVKNKEKLSKECTAEMKEAKQEVKEEKKELKAEKKKAKGKKEAGKKDDKTKTDVKVDSKAAKKETAKAATKETPAKDPNAKDVKKVESAPAVKPAAPAAPAPATKPTVAPTAPAAPATAPAPAEKTP